MEDAAILARCPDYISVGTLLKATPSTEGDGRFLFFEASNEDVDHQNEVVLQKALADSAEYYLRHGNLDISHYSLLGPKSGLANFLEFEIGKPVDVKVDGARTFVKAQLYKGDSPMAKNANMVWDSLTKQSPPARWYPSVGGAVLAKSIKLDPDTGDKVAVIEKVRWSNIALDRMPVNRTVPEVSTAPVGTFAKSLGGFVVAKSLQAGYGSDVAALAGGEALRGQSLDGAPASYFDFRELVAKAMRGGSLKNPDSKDIVSYAQEKLGLPLHEAAEFTERFMRDIKKGLKRSLQ